MSESEIVDITLSSKKGARTFLDKFELEIEAGKAIRFTTDDIAVTIFIPYPQDFFVTNETEFLEYTLDQGVSVTTPALLSTLDPDSVKEYQVYDITNNCFAWKNESSPPKIKISGD